ncbi:MAG: hypothetical protein GX447_08315 [Elusimicrobia bacterium]|nr:hypothetical protein [Elusimicrobiota bacterium]
MSAAFRTLISFLFIPLNIAVLFSFSVFSPILSLKSGPIFFFSGAIIFAVLYVRFPEFFRKPYILAHELSHAMAGIILGNKIKKIKIKSDSGYVSFGAKPDFITSLAPYIFPFYCALFALIFFAISLFADIKHWRNIFLAAQGFFICFHAANTISVMTSDLQSDFKKTKSVFLSYMAVFFLNLIFFAFIIKMLFPEKTNLTLFFRESFSNLKSISAFMFSSSLKLLSLIKEIL